MSDRFLDELRDEVARAARRADAEDLDERRRRSPWPLAAAAALAVIAALGASLTLRTTPAAADLEVIRQGDELVFRLSDVGTRGAEIEQAAAEHGLDIRVEEVPVGPYNEGRVVSWSGTGPYLTDRFHPESPDGQDTFRGFRVPVDFEGSLLLGLGRQAEPGEDWAASSPATGPGEPLACRPLVTAPLRDTVDALAGTDLVVDALVDESAGGVVVRDPSRAELDALGASLVARLDRIAPDRLWISVATDLEDAALVVEPEGC